MVKGSRKRERKWEIIMSQSPPKKDKPSKKIKSSRRPKLAEKQAIFPLNTESHLGTLWKWV